MKKAGVVSLKLYIDPLITLNVSAEFFKINLSKNSLSKINREKKEILIVNGLNCNYLDRDNSCELKQNFKFQGLKQLIEATTRITGHHCVKRVRIRSYSGKHFFAFRLRRGDTEYLSVFSLNAGKCGPE